MRKFTKKFGTNFKKELKKKLNFYEINFKQKINKAKKLWKTLKFMGLTKMKVFNDI